MTENDIDLLHSCGVFDAEECVNADKLMEGIGMSDFKSWDEVEEYLRDFNGVNASSWTFTELSMCCWDPGCCDCDFEDVDETIEHMKELVELNEVCK